MEPRFHPAMEAAWSGELDRFASLLDEAPELATGRSSSSHPTLLQFVVLDGGMGKIDEPEPFLSALIARGAELGEAIVAAASIGSKPIVIFLLDAGASVEACAPWTPLEESVYWAHRGLIRYLLEQRQARVPSLRAAAGIGDIELVERFLDGDRPRPGAGPVRFPWGTASEDPQDVLDQALVIAAKNGQAASARRLLECGADANAFPPGVHERGGPLHVAAMEGRSEVVSLLLEAGADANRPDPEHGSTPSGWAEYSGFQDLAEQLRALED